MKKLSTLLIALSLGYAANAQIPNAGFESWTPHTGYDTPDGWATADSVLKTLPISVGNTCEKGTLGATGSSYIKLTSISIPTLGALPGIAASGRLSVSTSPPSVTPSGGFAWSTRSEKLTGEWQYAPGAGDQGSIMVFLSKWNGTSRDTISYTNYTLPTGTVSAWTAFEIPLTYQHGGVPDSALIVMLSGKATGGTAGSTLSIDNLSFTGTVPNNVVSVSGNSAAISVFPNPASGFANIGYESNTAGNVHISVVNISGSMVTEMDFKKNRGANTFPINLKSMAAGMYFVKVSDDNGVAVKKLFVE